MTSTKKGMDLISRIQPRLILPESDGPFASHKGHPIMPWDAMDVAHDLSELWSVSSQTVEETLLKNLDSLIIS
jgi:TatD DNase family protein